MYWFGAVSWCVTEIPAWLWRIGLSEAWQRIWGKNIVGMKIRGALHMWASPPLSALSTKHYSTAAFCLWSVCKFDDFSTFRTPCDRNFGKLWRSRCNLSDASCLNGVFSFCSGIWIRHNSADFVEEKHKCISVGDNAVNLSWLSLKWGVT